MCSSRSPTGANTARTAPPEFTGGRKQKVNGKCGLLGQKLGHSYSPAIHGMLADYDYQLFEREPEQLEDFLKNGPWDGINVTIPYKKAVLPYCAELSDTARRIGSVNTIVRRPDGSLYGDNTDDPVCSFIHYELPLILNPDYACEEFYKNCTNSN